MEEFFFLDRSSMEMSEEDELSNYFVVFLVGLEKSSSSSYILLAQGHCLLTLANVLTTRKKIIVTYPTSKSTKCPGKQDRTFFAP